MPKLVSLLDPQVIASPLYREALTHRSAGSRHNERLEFLGDSVLGLIVTEHIYAALPDAKEGDLSRLRASLVNKDSLAELASHLHMGDSIALGQGELKSGGFRRQSILADALEAVIGAVFLVLGFEGAKSFVLSLYGERLQRLPSVESLKDPKTRLQELLQGRGADLPDYRVIEVTGEPHCQTFTVACEVAEFGIGVTGRGGSRRKAEQDAAEQALNALQDALEKS